MRNWFLVVEGLSGSGKTTVGKIVAEKIGAEFYETPPPLFCSIRDKIDRNSTLEARFLFYLSGVFQASEEISLIAEKKPIVCNRYILTTLCYHRAVGVNINLPSSFFDLLLKPDFTFLIICNEEILRKRLYERGLSFNDLQERKPGTEEKFLAEYRKNNLIEIDNSEENPGKSADKIIKFLRE